VEFYVPIIKLYSITLDIIDKYTRLD